MTLADPQGLLVVARAAAAAGADVALRWRRRAASLHITEKAGPHDLVSQADTEAEAAIRSTIEAHRAHDAVLGEESGGRHGTTGVQWVIDPIDGTTSYLYGRADWAVSVAAMTADASVLAAVVAEPVGGRVTYACAGGGTFTNGERVPPLVQTDLRRALVEINLGRPEQKHLAGRMVDALVPQVRDLRRSGSAAAALAQVATGRADAAWVPGLQLWDCAAGVLLVTEAGGTVGDLAGPTPGRVPASGDVLAAPAGLWEPLRDLLRPAYVVSLGRQAAAVCRGA